MAEARQVDGKQIWGAYTCYPRENRIFFNLLFGFNVGVNKIRAVEKERFVNPGMELAHVVGLK